MLVFISWTHVLSKQTRPFVVPEAPFSWAGCSAGMLWPVFPIEALPGDVWVGTTTVLSPPLPLPKEAGHAHIPITGPQWSPAGGWADTDSLATTLSHHISLDELLHAGFLCARSSCTSPLLFLHLITSKNLILCKNILL